MPIVTAILAVFTDLIGWFVEALNSASAIFYTESGLTVIGSVSVLGLGFAIVLLLFNWIKSILNFG